MKYKKGDLIVRSSQLAHSSSTAGAYEALRDFDVTGALTAWRLLQGIDEDTPSGKAGPNAFFQWMCVSGYILPRSYHDLYVTGDRGRMTIEHRRAPGR